MDDIEAEITGLRDRSTHKLRLAWRQCIAGSHLWASVVI